MSRPKKAVLLVDSNPARAGEMAYVLGLWGRFEISLCREGKVAADLVQQRYYEILIISIDLKDMAPNSLIDHVWRVSPETRTLAVADTAKAAAACDAASIVPREGKAFMWRLREQMLILSTRKRGPKRPWPLAQVHA